MYSYPIFFLYSEEFLSQDPPLSLSADWSRFGASCEGTIFATMIGIREAGIPVSWGSCWPDRNIVVAHPDNLSRIMHPASWDNYLVCWQQDRMRCDYAHIHVVMNRLQLTKGSLPFYDHILIPGPRVWLHYLPEPSIIERSSGRGDAFINIAYLGAPKNMLPTMLGPAWEQALESERLRFCLHADSGGRSDYSGVDCVIAVRPPNRQVELKSPHKLWNAWRAGVPAILGPEPGFRDYRKSELDYIEVNDAEGALAALRRLRDDPGLRRAMVENGRVRAKECSVETLVGQWKEFIEGDLQREAAAWFGGSPARRGAFMAARRVRMALRALRERARGWKGGKGG